jgi:hypothetical protein
MERTIFLPRLSGVYKWGFSRWQRFSGGMIGSAYHTFEDFSSSSPTLPISRLHEFAEVRG